MSCVVGSHVQVFAIFAWNERRSRKRTENCKGDQVGAAEAFRFCEFVIPVVLIAIIYSIGLC